MWEAKKLQFAILSIHVYKAAFCDFSEPLNFLKVDEYPKSAAH